MTAVGRIRGWPATLSEPDLLDAPVVLRPVRVSDARTWREIPGIAEALRSAGAAAGVPSAILSRGLAGVASSTLIVNLPGSSGGVRDGMNVLRPILVHAVDQIRGGDHARADAESGNAGSSGDADRSAEIA